MQFAIRNNQINLLYNYFELRMPLLKKMDHKNIKSRAHAPLVQFLLKKIIKSLQ